MSSQRQWAMFGCAIGIGFIVYVLLDVKAVPHWMYGAFVAALVWGFGYNLELSKVRANQLLEEMRAIREVLDQRLPPQS